MKETAQQYISRILAFSEDKDPITVLGTTADRLTTLVNSTPIERWDRRPAPDVWTPRQVLAHLADVEIVTGWRMRSILATDGVPLQPFDQSDWGLAFKYSAADIGESLATFSALRAGLLSLLTRVDGVRLEHHGMHGERGRETITHLLKLCAGHDLNHLGQIETRLKDTAL
jgi:hypothetical protein